MFIITLHQVVIIALKIEAQDIAQKIVIRTDWVINTLALVLIT